MSRKVLTTPTDPKYFGRHNIGGKVLPAGPERIAVARAIFEGEPGSTCESVGAALGVPASSVRRWKAEGNWKALPKRLPELSGRAGELANSFKVKMSELGKPLDDAVAAAEVSAALADDMAIDVRARIIDRHRREWSAPRKLAYEAVQKGDFDKAKLAKITSETLTLIQHGECRAYGIAIKDKGTEGGTVVVIDRTEGGDDGAEGGNHD